MFTDGFFITSCITKSILDKAISIFTGIIASSFIVFPKLKGLTEEGQKGTMELEVIAEDAYFQPYEEDFEVNVSKKVTVEVLSKEEKKPQIVVERITPETELMKMLKENGITKKMLVKNKSRFTPVLHNYYKEANIKEGFNVFLSKVLKRLD